VFVVGSSYVRVFSACDLHAFHMSRFFLDMSEVSIILGLGAPSFDRRFPLRRVSGGKSCILLNAVVVTPFNRSASLMRQSCREWSADSKYSCRTR